MLDYIDECNSQIIDGSVIRMFIAKLGYEEELHIMYKIPIEDKKYNLMRLDTGEHVSNVVAIGIIYGEVELFLVNDFHNRFVEGEMQSCTSYLGVNGDTNITFKECNAGANVVHDDSEGEEFYDSNYEFRSDDDEMIYDKYVNVDVDKRGELVVNCGTGLEKEKDLSNVNHTERELQW
ncbi:hypothetical protein ACH5RR_029761 [Cinchona calisaya]|uniref:Uncharacterized protein n=1 Tax=Cinchona calisaya TaxID=153742 RepID=A0ABD2YW50_9GENT